MILMKKIPLYVFLVLMFSLFTSYSFAENKVNFTVSASEDFTGKEFKSDKKGCGLNKYQKGLEINDGILINFGNSLEFQIFDNSDISTKKNSVTIN